MPKRKTNCCLMPRAIEQKESDMWKKLHALKCERNRKSHSCRGTITIDAKSVTLNCPACGDARSKLI